MPVITDKQRAVIGKESTPRPVPDDVNMPMARHWSEMVEDPNPIYFDEAYARNTWLQGRFAPPSMLFTWARRGPWPLGEDVGSLEGPLGQLALEDCPLTIAVKAVHEYFQPLRYGDTLTFTMQISSVSDEKKTRLGIGHFVVTLDTCRNQFEQVVGTHSFTLFFYRLHDAEGES